MDEGKRCYRGWFRVGRTARECERVAPDSRMEDADWQGGCGMGREGGGGLMGWVRGFADTTGGLRRRSARRGRRRVGENDENSGGCMAEETEVEEDVARLFVCQPRWDPPAHPPAVSSLVHPSRSPAPAGPRPALPRVLDPPFPTQLPGATRGRQAIPLAYGLLFSTYMRARTRLYL